MSKIQSINHYYGREEDYQVLTEYLELVHGFLDNEFLFAKNELSSISEKYGLDMESPLWESNARKVITDKFDSGRFWNNFEREMFMPEYFFYHHSTFVTMLYGLLDTTLKGYCELLDNLPLFSIKLADTKQKGLSKYREFFTRNGVVAFSELDSRWDDFVCLGSIRNALVHNRGFINDDLNNRELRRLSRYLKQFPQYFGLTSIGRLTINYDYCKHINTIVNSTLRKFHHSIGSDYQVDFEPNL